MAVLRAVLAVVAIPLAPVLYQDHFLAVVLLRPTKEVLLVGGFLVRQGDVGVAELAAAYVPLAVFGVWNLFFLGRVYADRIEGGDLPKAVTRILPPERIAKLQEVLGRKGTRVVFLGRLAAFPSTLVAAAAGASDMPTRRFLPADGAGAGVALAEVVLAGYALGAAYKEAGPWLAVLGVAVLAALAVLVGRQLHKA